VDACISPWVGYPRRVSAAILQARHSACWAKCWNVHCPVANRRNAASFCKGLLSQVKVLLTQERDLLAYLNGGWSAWPYHPLQHRVNILSPHFPMGHTYRACMLPGCDIPLEIAFSKAI